MQGQERGVTVASLALREAFSSVYVLAVCFSPFWKAKLEYVGMMKEILSFH